MDAKARSLSWTWLAARTYAAESLEGSKRLFSSTAERSASFVAGQTKPMVQRFNRHINAVNELANRGLETMEANSPVMYRRLRTVTCATTSGMRRLSDLVLPVGGHGKEEPEEATTPTSVEVCSSYPDIQSQPIRPVKLIESPRSTGRILDGKRSVLSWVVDMKQESVELVLQIPFIWELVLLHKMAVKCAVVACWLIKVCGLILDLVMRIVVAITNTISAHPCLFWALANLVQVAKRLPLDLVYVVGHIVHWRGRLREKVDRLSDQRRRLRQWAAVRAHAIYHDTLCCTAEGAAPC